MTPELITTEDGSSTYLHPIHGASYRSTRGAATESQHVFINGAQLPNRPSPWQVLELGFGTGLNFAITLKAAQQANVALHYTSLEPEPMRPDLWLVDDIWRSLTPGQPQQHQQHTLTLHRHGWQDQASHPHHALFHDPFGPAVAPECWSVDCFRWAAANLTEDGVLATYGASSAARHAMKEAGLLVGSLPGAPGKREMTVAARTAQAILHAKPWKR